MRVTAALVVNYVTAALNVIFDMMTLIQFIRPTLLFEIPAKVNRNERSLV